MKIIRDLAQMDRLPNAVVTLGNFDGVHLGHRQIFRRLRDEAADLGGVSVVITFEPHPLKLLNVGKQISLITTYREKEKLIGMSMIDYLVVIPFTIEFSRITPDDFVREILVGRIGAKRLIIGYDYAFGRNREGNVEFLRSMGRIHGFNVEVLPPIGNETLTYSSSAIRKLVAQGSVREVVEILGRHFSLEGTVVHGFQRGKFLGFPTANVSTDKELIPRDGVYAVKILVNGSLFNGACNIGTNPTFGDGLLSIEVFILDFNADLYGNQVNIFFVDRVRDENKFETIDELRGAIAHDIEVCRSILADVEPVGIENEMKGVSSC